MAGFVDDIKMAEFVDELHQIGVIFLHMTWKLSNLSVRPNYMKCQEKTAPLILVLIFQIFLITSKNDINLSRGIFD